MPSWSDVEAQAPDLCALARRYLDAHVHKTLATLRRDGSPRISGTEIELRDGELWFGSMWQALKARDLRRDPRFAIHSGSDDPPAWTGDAKLAGTAIEIADDGAKEARRVPGQPPGPYHLFRADVTELSVVHHEDGADHLIVESWHAGRGLSRFQRR
jgi:hypothetical protein